MKNFTENQQMVNEIFKDWQTDYGQIVKGSYYGPCLVKAGSKIGFSLIKD